MKKIKKINKKLLKLGIITSLFPVSFVIACKSDELKLEIDIPKLIIKKDGKQISNILKKIAEYFENPERYQKFEFKIKNFKNEWKSIKLDKTKIKNILKSKEFEEIWKIHQKNCKSKDNLIPSKAEIIKKIKSVMKKNNIDIF